ncbi:MAG: helix-turn-helix transcriptional regulator [Petrotogales bacterium]
MINYVRYFRKKNGLTQGALAEKVGVTRQTIIAIEKGKFNPSVKLALKFSNILECELEQLFELEEDDWNE